MPWVQLAISAVGYLSAASQSSQQNKSQQAWNEYNAANRYNTDMTNIAAQTALAGVNARLAQQQADMNASYQRKVSARNAEMIQSTMVYNDALLENEIQLRWESTGLDLKQLADQRMIERGTIVATQASSGTVIGEESNAAVVTDQMTQEAMDAFIVSRGADIQINKIKMEQAKSLSEGNNQINKVLWEGEMGAIVAQNNGQAQAIGALASANIAAQAGSISATNQYKAGMSGAANTYNNNDTTIKNNMMSGLFGAASQGAQNYYGGKTATSQLPSSGATGTGSSGAGSSLMTNSNMNWGGR